MLIVIKMGWEKSASGHACVYGMFYKSIGPPSRERIGRRAREHPRSNKNLVPVQIVQGGRSSLTQHI